MGGAICLKMQFNTRLYIRHSGVAEKKEKCWFFSVYVDVNRHRDKNNEKKVIKIQFCIIESVWFMAASQPNLKSLKMVYINEDCWSV